MLSPSSKNKNPKIDIPVKTRSTAQGFLIDGFAKKAKLAGNINIKRKFAIIRYWPGQPAAEHESVERYKLAAQQIGIEVIEVDKNGYVLEGMKRKLMPDEVDFALNLHFETQKRFDCFSISALWNPMRFYHDWGYTNYINNQFSHDGYFTCGSQPIDSLLKLELPEGNYFQTVVNHTLTGPLYKPELRDDRVAFYAGINWEKITQQKGRFEDILSELDKKESIHICGPEKVQGINVWEGYKGYKGEVPFDGTSIIKSIHEAGICLVLSSDAHVESEIMSSRLFECAASGSVAIANNNRFIEKYFPNAVNTFDSSAKDAPKQVLDLINDINTRKEHYLEQANLLQNMFIEKYLLQDQLYTLYENLISYKASLNQYTLSTTNTIGLVVIDDDINQGLFEKLVQSLANQTYKHFNVYIIEGHKKGIDINYAELIAQKFGITLKFTNINVKIGKKLKNLGMLIGEVFEKIPEDNIIILRGYEELYSDGLARINRSITQKPNADVHLLSYNVKHYDGINGIVNNEFFYDYKRSTHNTQKEINSLSSIVFTRKFIKNNEFTYFMSFEFIKNIITPLLFNINYVEGPAFDVDLKYLESKAFEKEDLVYNTTHQEYILSKFLHSMHSKFVPFEDGIKLSAMIAKTAPTYETAGLVIQQVIREGGVSAETITNWTPGDKRKLAVELVKALPIPAPIFKMMRGMVRVYMKLRHR